MIFDWITPAVGLLSCGSRATDIFGTLGYMTGTEMCHELRKKGCGPVWGSLSVESDGSFVISVRDPRRARSVLLDIGCELA